MAATEQLFRLRGPDGRPLKVTQPLSVSEWPLQLQAEVSDGTSIQLIGHGITCTPASLTAGITTVTVTLHPAPTDSYASLELECRVLQQVAPDNSAQTVRFLLQKGDLSLPGQFPRRNRWLLQQCPQDTAPDDSWKHFNRVYRVWDTAEGSWDIPVLLTPKEFAAAGEHIELMTGYTHPQIWVTDKGHLLLRGFSASYYQGKFTRIYGRFANGTLQCIQNLGGGTLPNGSRDTFWQCDSSNPIQGQWLDRVESGPRLAWTTDSIVSVSQQGKCVQRWQLPADYGPPVAGAQLSTESVLLITAKQLSLVVDLAATDPVITVVGRLWNAANGQPASLWQYKYESESAAANSQGQLRFSFRTAGIEGPVWSDLVLQPQSVLSSAGLKIPFEVEHVVKSLRFLTDAAAESNIEPQRSEQLQKDFALRTLRKFDRWFLPLLAESLHREDLSRACRHFCLDLLRELKSEEIIGDLLYLAFCGDEAFGLRAVELLADYPGMKGLEALGIVLLAHHNVKLRELAIQCLRDWGSALVKRSLIGPDDRPLFVAVLRLLCRACGDRDTRPGGLRRQALWAMLLLLRELLSLSDQSVSRGVISTAADAICAAWCDLYQKFSNRWKLDAVVFLYLAARGLKQGWLPKSAYETALNTLHTAVMNPDRCVRLRALRCLRRLQDRGSLEDLYRSMAEYQDTAAVFIRAISSFAT